MGHSIDPLVHVHIHSDIQLGKEHYSTLQVTEQRLQGTQLNICRDHSDTLLHSCATVMPQSTSRALSMSLYSGTTSDPIFPLPKFQSQSTPPFSALRCYVLDLISSQSLRGRHLSS